MISIVHIGKHDEYFNLIENLKNVNYKNYDFIEPHELIKIYNDTRINLLFSGRDALPRVLIESIACGCYNITLDTLSDGKFLYNNIFGSILSFPELIKTFDKSTKSISYSSNNNIFESILKYKDLKFNHKDISLKFINLNY